MAKRTMRSNRKSGVTRGFTELGILAVCVIIIGVIYKTFLADGVMSMLEDNFTTSLFSMVFIGVAFMTNGLYAFAYTRITALLEDEPKRFVSSIVPVWSDINLKLLYEANDIPGPLGIINLIVSVIKSLVCWGGMLFVSLKYGFLYFYEPHMYWLVATFAMYVLHIAIKTITLGVIYASYNEYLSASLPNLFYIKHIIYTIILIVYFVSIPVAAFFNINLAFFNSKVMNFITIVFPFILPTVSVLDACKVRRQVESAFSTYESEDDYYDDSEY